MANVNISMQDGRATVVPLKVMIGGSTRDLTIIWNLAPGAGGWKFATTPAAGIVCEKTPPPKTPPPPYDPWDGTDAKPGPGPNQYTATGIKVSAPKTYKYSIHLVSGAGQVLDIDPEIMNDPPTS
jgi:hypothetical protein